MQLLALILYFAVFTLLLIALIIYISFTLYRFFLERKREQERRAALELEKKAP